jgi:hypothetical protein
MTTRMCHWPEDYLLVTGALSKLITIKITLATFGVRDCERRVTKTS